MDMFRGRYQHTIDPKGRLSVPAKYRDVLAQYEGHTVVVVPNEESLEVYPLEEWERIEGKINEQSQFDLEVRKLGRLYISRAKEVLLDGAGRILLPPDSRQQAGLQRDVTLVGLGRKHFEVWDRTRFDEYERTNGDALSTGFERLAQLGV
ncbi:MAG: division/cell wall cluster transcriptional repressor MraZ [Candidatus Rokubacteria bacterium]|nr:division/cell wall cluster transcriptional repressor MraZ [Candidatus Rokubacteria bacterium]